MQEKSSYLKFYNNVKRLLRVSYFDVFAYRIRVIKEVRSRDVSARSIFDTDPAMNYF